jgi:type II secretory pathway pseudopilin PulG
MWVAFVLGTLLSLIVICFIFVPRFRRELLRASGNSATANGSFATAEFSVRAKGIATSLVVIFLLALLAIALVPRFSESPLAAAEQAKDVNEEAARAQQELKAAVERTTQLSADIEKLKNVRLEAFYTGEHARAPFGKHFPCGTDVGAAAQSMCGDGTALSVKPISTHGGNKCGYGYYAVACVSQ